MVYFSFSALTQTLMQSHFESLDGAADLTLACCYLGIAALLGFDLWSRRQSGVSVFGIAIASLFLISGLGRTLRAATLLEFDVPIFWQTVLDLGAVVPAIAFLSFRHRYRVLTESVPREVSISLAQPQLQTDLQQALEQRDQELQQQSQHLNATLTELKRTQKNLMQMEKMAMLGQLMSGIAHEINNPIGFTCGNLVYLEEYIHGLLQVMQAYQTSYPDPAVTVRTTCEAVDLDFILEDLPRLVNSMKLGTERVKEIVETLRGFYRLDEAEMQAVDLQQGIDSTLLLLNNRYKGKIEIDRQFNDIPPVECYITQLNQVFMNLIANAIDALLEVPASDEPHHQRQIAIATRQESPNQVSIQISDNGPGMSADVQECLFEPFFTTKPMGIGTGLGLSICYQIITETHHGQILCCSAPGEGTTFMVKLPIHQAEAAGMNIHENGKQPAVSPVKV